MVSYRTTAWSASHGPGGSSSRMSRPISRAWRVSLHPSANRSRKTVSRAPESVQDAQESMSSETRWPISSSASAAESKARNSCGVSRSEEHTSELQSLMRISYAVFCLKKKKKKEQNYIMTYNHNTTVQY